MQTATKRTVLGAMLAGAMLLSAGAPAAWAQMSAQPGKAADQAKEKMKQKAQEKAHKAAAAKIGEPAPAFKLKDLEGKEHELADYKGKIVVLEWYNPGCPFVKKHHEAKTMANLYNEYKDQNVVWLAVATGRTAADTGELADSTGEFGIEYPVLLDTNSETGRAYGAKATPHMFVINPDGVLVYAGAIDNLPSAGKKVGDVNYVKEALDAVVAGETVETAETKAYGCQIKY